MRENTLMLQRPSIQALFEGYEFYPYGGGMPIPAPLLRKPKDRQELAELETGHKVQSSSTQQTVQSQVPATTQGKNYLGSVIRNPDASLILDPTAQGSLQAKQASDHTRARSLNMSAYQTNQSTNSQALNGSLLGQNDGRPVRRHQHNQSVIVNNCPQPVGATSNTNDQLSDIQSSISVALGDKQK